MKRPHVLCILDGWGLAEPGPYNSISEAHAPHWQNLWHTCPHSVLKASEDAVGLPLHQMGNSEVGHMTIGAGRKIYQDLPRINQAIHDKSLFQTPAIEKILNTKGTLHFIGMVSSGGVHSHSDHLKALIDFFSPQKKVVLHAFLDGRDCPPQSAKTFIKMFSPLIGTLSGRYYAMDRDERWDRTQKAHDTLAKAHTPHIFHNSLDHIQACYDKGIIDEFIPPARHTSYEGMKPDDALFFFNFRADRMRQLVKTFVDPSFDFFTTCSPKVVVGMTDYGDALTPYYHRVFLPQTLNNTLGQVIEKAGFTQKRMAETEKYAHVTFFFNGGREAVFKGETRVLIPSPKVTTYDLCPEMSAHALTDAAVETILEGKTDLIVMNYANADMVGHTGHRDAARQAVEVIDICLGRLENALQKQKGLLCVTADHGNVEAMKDDNHEPHTAHTLNPVPFVIKDFSHKPLTLFETGTLADIAPTLLTLMGLDVPLDMTGKILIKSNI